MLKEFRNFPTIQNQKLNQSTRKKSKISQIRGVPGVWEYFPKNTLITLTPLTIITSK
jgi:hypothetical protein